jgi:hypothetical protein
MEVGTVLLVVLGAAALAGIRLAVGLRARGAGRQARLRTIERTGKDPADNWFNNSINDWAARHPVGKGGRIRRAGRLLRPAWLVERLQLKGPRSGRRGLATDVVVQDEEREAEHPERVLRAQ